MSKTHESERRGVELFVCGDVMTGRGIDQVLAHSVDPVLFEPYMRSAQGYVEIAERASGAIPEEVPPNYPWGVAIEILEERSPEARLINLETAITAGGGPWPGKGIHYRMHPGNVGILEAAGIDAAVLANNHVLDWGQGGLEDTLAALDEAGIVPLGAGRDAASACAPYRRTLGGSLELKLVAFAHGSAGVPAEWAAGEGRQGVARLDALGARGLDQVREALGNDQRAEGEGSRSLRAVSIHWGGNWGYEVPAAHRDFAHALIDELGVDLLWGHSSHHPMGIEVHAGRPVLYGCGDLLNDYEGIGGHEEYRPSLSLLYFPRFDVASAALVSLEMVPLRIERFALHRASDEESAWLAERMQRECSRFGTGIERQGEVLALRW